jgi:hypothetical protein
MSFNNCNASFSIRDHSFHFGTCGEDREQSACRFDVRTSRWYIGKTILLVVVHELLRLMSQILALVDRSPQKEN